MKRPVKLTTEQELFFENRRLKLLLQDIMRYLDKARIVLPEKITTEIKKEL